MMDTGTSTFVVTASRQTLSLHACDRTLSLSTAGPGVAESETRTGTTKTGVAAYVSVSMPNVASRFTLGAGPVAAAARSNGGVGETEISRGVGPPDFCVSEYICQPGSIVARTVTGTTCPTTIVTAFLPLPAANCATDSAAGFAGGADEQDKEAASVNARHT